MTRLLPTLVAVPLVSFAAGCAHRADTARPPAPGTAIRHVVLIELADPTDFDALVADCDRRLAALPEVRSYWRGKPVDIGRPQVDGNYTLGLTVDFDSLEDYGAYLVHPEHEALVAAWRPRWKAARIFDFGVQPLADR